MLEALLALGLAGNVIQLVDFGSKLVARGREIHKSGSLNEIEELRRVAIDSIQQVDRIKDSLIQSAASTGSLSKEEQVPIP